MPHSLSESTGIETVKVLLGTMSVPDFTVDELARRTGVSRRTVDTIRRRYQYLFERLPQTEKVARGRPAVRWQLSLKYLDEVVAAVEAHQAVLTAGHRSPDAVNVAEASLVVATAAIARTPASPEEAKQLVKAARHSLATAGYLSDDPSGCEWDGELSVRIRFTAAVADVVEACLGDDQQEIDRKQARAVPLAVEATQHMSVAEWQPLAQKVCLAGGTVLSAPVLVAEKSLDYFNDLFPTLEVAPGKKSIPSGYVAMTDTRAELPAILEPNTSLLSAETRGEFRQPAEPLNCVVVSRSLEVLESVRDYGARFILRSTPANTRTDVANVVNQRACGFEVLGGVMPSRALNMSWSGAFG